MHSKIPLLDYSATKNFTPIAASSDVILKNPEEFEIDEAAEEKLDALQIERYYRKETTSQKSTPPSEKSNLPDRPVPPFDLHIDE